jgi:ABC-type uncharacterized transport system substrate-binding protein
MRLIGLAVALILSLALAPLAAEAQEAAKKTAKIGYLGFSTSSLESERIGAFREGLRELGYVEGRNLTIEYRWAEGKLEQLQDLAQQLVSLKPDVIVAMSNDPIIALKRATQAIPIVMASSGDVVVAGLVASLARPGGNVTGLTNLSDELSTKWLELLWQAVPTLSRVAVIRVPQSSPHAVRWRDIQAAAQRIGVTTQSVEVQTPGDIERGYDVLRKDRVNALIVLPHAVTVAHRKQIVDLALRNRLPGMYPWREFAMEGGLVSYSASLPELYRRAATYVDKILKGAKPADLPVEQPTKFELVINLKTAKALGLTIPPSLLQRADEVIQ